MYIIEKSTEVPKKSVTKMRLEELGENLLILEDVGDEGVGLEELGESLQNLEDVGDGDEGLE